MFVVVVVGVDDVVVDVVVDVIVVVDVAVVDEDAGRGDLDSSPSESDFID